MLGMDIATDCARVRCRGFTLVEILLAMLITSILVLGIRGMYRQAHVIWSAAEDKRPVYHAIRIITETLRQETSGLYIPPAGEDDSEPVFALTYIPGQQTELLFYTLTPSWRGGLESSRMARVRYIFTKDEDSGEAVLSRTEQPCAGEKLIGAESSDIVVTGLSDFRISVANPNSDARGELWIPSYDSKDRPPRAVKMLLKWKNPEDTAPSEFEASFPIICQASLGPTEAGQEMPPAPPWPQPSRAERPPPPPW